MVHDLRWRRLASIDIRTIGPGGRRQTIWILRGRLDMRMNSSHTGRRRILRRRIWMVCGGRRRV